MKRLPFFITFALWCGLSAATAPTPVRAEIEDLLTKLQTSGCQFNRNGSWHSGSEAKEHLLGKFEYLERRDAIHSTEEFIELAASKSSLSGKPYEVKCGNAPSAESRTWLTDQLTAIRAQTSKNKP